MEELNLNQEELSEETEEETKAGEPEAREEEEEKEVADIFVPKVYMHIYVDKKGGLKVSMEGSWKAKQIRAIQVAVIKAYRKHKKEAIIKKEE